MYVFVPILSVFTGILVISLGFTNYSCLLFNFLFLVLLILISIYFGLAYC